MTPTEMKHAAETLEKINGVLSERGYKIETGLDWFRLKDDEDGGSIPISIDEGYFEVAVY